MPIKISLSKTQNINILVSLKKVSRDDYRDNKREGFKIKMVTKQGPPCNGDQIPANDNSWYQQERGLVSMCLQVCS